MHQTLQYPSFLNPLLEDWRQQLSQWAQTGALSRAALEALRLPEEPAALQRLVERWQTGDFQDLPPVVGLPGNAMPSAAGAYAISTGTIYLSLEWLQSASRERLLSVLTEELGHHLDRLLNLSDTPGDEGELFAALLGGASLSEQQHLSIVAQTDHTSIEVSGLPVAVEQAATVISTPIPVTSPLKTGGEAKNGYAFAALKSDGSVVTWGSEELGGDSSAVASKLSSDVMQIFSNFDAFAAIKSDGSVVSWGDFDRGGDSSAAASKLMSGVTKIFSSWYAFAAIKSDGSVVTWGNSTFGGDSSAVASKLSSSVMQISSTGGAFAALKSDGSVVTWGQAGGGDSSAVASKLSSGVTQIFSTYNAFAALKSDGSVVTWGGEWGGRRQQCGSQQAQFRRDGGLLHKRRLCGSQE